MKPTTSALAIPLVVLTFVGSAVTAKPLAACLPLVVDSTLASGVSVSIALALHLVWIVPALRRTNPILVGVSWLVTMYLTAGGFAVLTETQPTTAAPVLDTLILGLALAHTPAASWPDRLARWRRSRERIATELRMGDGLIPWLRSIASRITHGEADRPRSSAFDVLVANLDRSNDRIHRTIASLALPDAVRESLRTTAQRIVTDAETTLARMAIDLERRALDHAALCRDAILALDYIPDAERDRLAHDCESLILDLAHDVGSVALPTHSLRGK